MNKEIKEISLEPKYLARSAGDARSLEDYFRIFWESLIIESPIDREYDRLRLFVHNHHNLIIMPMNGKITAVHPRKNCSIMTIDGEIKSDFAVFSIVDSDGNNSGYPHYKMYYEFNEDGLMDLLSW